MKKYVILGDVTCDLSQEIRDHFGIGDYVHGYVHFSDGRDFQTKLDWTNISYDDFYKALSNKHLKITTAPASPEEYYEVFHSYAEDGYDVLSISISSKISSTYNTALKAAERVMAENPDSRIYCVDSMRMSGSLGLLVMYAKELQNEGKTMDEVIEWLEGNKQKVHQIGPIDDLMFVARRGRISTGKAIMGSFAGVKPMGDCSSDGYVSVLTKAKGMKKALALSVAYTKEVAVNIEDQYVLIAHSNRKEYAQTLKEMVEKELNPKKVFVTDVFTGCAPNIGPGMVSVNFLGDTVSEEQVREKELMSKAIESIK